MTPEGSIRAPEHGAVRSGGIVITTETQTADTPKPAVGESLWDVLAAVQIRPAAGPTLTVVDRAVDDRETIIITRRSGARVALLAADELASYQETAHLLRSPVVTRSE